MNFKVNCCLSLSLIILTLYTTAQHHHEPAATHNSLITNVEPQPLLAQALRVSEALNFIGSSLPTSAFNQLQALKDLPYNEQTVKKIQQVLDPFCLALVDINPEARVKVANGPAKPELMQQGWTSYLVKVHNQAHVSAALVAESPNAGTLFHTSTNSPRMQPENKLTPGQIDNRFLEISVYRNKPLQSNLSGLELEYAVIQLYSRSKGKREAEIGFNVGQGTQDIGFRNTINILFNIRPAVKMIFDVRDDDNSPAMASFIITDGIERFRNSKVREMRYPWRDWEQDKPLSPETFPETGKLRGIYPLPSRRLAAEDAFPDYYFQPQVYRATGEYVYLPPGNYDVIYTRGPEYLEQYQQITIPENKDSVKISFRLKRWIHMARLGWYSADHHIHAAGCSHYESPEEGVPPLDMFRQIKGEDLNLGSNLTWGPSWYHQKRYFTGKNNPLSDQHNLLRYDIEVSGFPSSHAGHIVLLNLKEDDYPNTTLIEQWPSWTLPVLHWAKSQGGVSAYAHSGWGLEPMVPTTELPNYVMPKMDGIGANEYIVTVTYDSAVDYYSVGDTPLPWELNMWYHTLNCGFRIPIGGETDFPCISDERVGQARTYAKLDEGLNFSSIMKAVKSGRSYVSDGLSHLIDFTVNKIAAGTGNSEVLAKVNATLNITVKAAAMLSKSQDEKGRFIASLPPEQFPYWNLERARIGSSRNVLVELIYNGQAVEKQQIPADGNWQNIHFNYQVKKSGWLAIRINYSSHTNPVFILVDGKPVRDKKSAVWCREAVDQCWKTKNVNIRKQELEAARKAYDHSRRVYDNIIKEAEDLSGLR